MGVVTQVDGTCSFSKPIPSCSAQLLGPVLTYNLEFLVRVLVKIFPLNNWWMYEQTTTFVYFFQSKPIFFVCASIPPFISTGNSLAREKGSRQTSGFPCFLNPRVVFWAPFLLSLVRELLLCISVLVGQEVQQHDELHRTTDSKRLLATFLSWSQKGLNWAVAASQNCCWKRLLHGNKNLMAPAIKSRGIWSFDGNMSGEVIED